jgi:Bardet-Biedl syndrome 9 protein
MSLFAAREWWRCSIATSSRDGTEEEFAHGTLVVANIDNDPANAAKIVTGSLQGNLRVHLPQKQDDPGDAQLLEVALGDPILQLESGCFVPNNQQAALALAVLHPRRLAVYRIVSSGAGGVHSAELLYQHSLGQHFTAYNMCSGPFGHSDGDSICVQSLDGKLQIFEQAMHLISRRFVTCLLPGPLCYAPKLDSFITANSAGEVECYSYKALAAAGDQAHVPSMRHDSTDFGDSGGGGAAGRGARGGVGGGLEGIDGAEADNAAEAAAADVFGAKKIQAEWVCRVGETVLDIRLGRLSPDLRAQQVDLLVLGERTLFVLHENMGTICEQKRFDYHPSCLCLYSKGGGALSGGTHQSMRPADLPLEQNLIVGTFENQVMIYSRSSLVWSALVPSAPIGLAVAQFGDAQGLIVALDEEGVLTVNYLGTDPPTSAVVAPSLKEPNYDEVDQEHRRLLNIIRESAQTDGRQDTFGNRLDLRVDCPRMVDPANGGANTSYEVLNDADELATERGPLVRTNDGVGYLGVELTINISHQGGGTLSDIQVSLRLPSYAVVREASFTVPSLAAAAGADTPPLTIPVMVFVQPDLLPETLDGVATAVYSTDSGEPRSVEAAFELPLTLVCRLSSPQARHKQGTFKLTIDTNKAPCQLKPLFSDLLAQFADEVEANHVTGATANSVMCFQYWGRGDGEEQQQQQQQFSGPEAEEGGGQSHHPVDATILVSKNAGRYRIQSSTLPALWMIAHSLTERLKRWFEAKGEMGLVLSYTEDPPFKDFFATVDAHFDNRCQLLDLRAQLNDRAHQYRIIEKRLLVRFKDRNPSALNRLDVLMEDTHRTVMDLAYAVEATQKQLKRSANSLSCVVSLMNMLITLRFELSEEDSAILRACLTPVVEDNDDMGWEEQVDAALAHLLRTSLAKSTKAGPEQQQSLHMPRDTSKFRRHLQIVVDRLSKGGALSGGGGPSGGEGKAV